MSQPRGGILLVIISGLIAAGAAAGCKNPPQPNPKNKAQAIKVQQILTKVGVVAEDSYYACLLNEFHQGIPLKQAREDCSTKLIEDGKKGFDAGPFGTLPGDTSSFYDPAKIAGACNSGDPEKGKGKHEANYPDGWGKYSWGKGAGKLGLDFDTSVIKKGTLVMDAKDEAEEFEKLEKEAREAEKALDDATKTGDSAKIEAAKKAYDDAEKKAIDQAKKATDAEAEAKKDPNKKPADPNPKKPKETGPESACEYALQEAREFLAECHRTQWKNFECQQLQAEMNDCPDPATILVDPEQGYTCGTKPDLESLKNAWVARCEDRKHFSSDNNPCEPPRFKEGGKYLEGSIQSVCNDPRAYIEPDSEMCLATFQVKPFGEVDIQKIAVWGLNKLGGPIIVLSDSGMDPHPGPEPRPGPKP